MHRATPENYLTAIKIIEEEFGLKWLQKKVKTASRRGYWGGHPIPKYWKEAKDALKEFASTGELRISRNLVALLKLAYELRQVRLLPNYQIAIRPKLKGNEFFKTQYEVYVGALSVRTGYHTEFISSSTAQGERTADLKLLAEGHKVYVECVQKDPYQPQKTRDNSLWQ